MFASIWSWFQNKELELKDILSHFNSIHDKLEVFIDTSNEKMQIKEAEAKRLMEEASKHSQDMAKAAKVQLNIKQFIGE